MLVKLNLTLVNTDRTNKYSKRLAKFGLYCFSLRYYIGKPFPIKPQLDSRRPVKRDKLSVLVESFARQNVSKT